MLFAMPSDDQLYQAMLDRDPSYDGQAWVCVRTTGIFCRLNCPARTPKRENCQFRETPAACLDAGFRPCRRCHPLGDDPVVAQLMAALQDRPTHRWTETDVAALGFDPSTVRRAFKRATGRTFLDLARQRRLAAGLRAIGGGARIIDAQLDAGFDSPGGFRAAVARLLNTAPADLAKDGFLRIDWIDTPLGPMVAVADASALLLLEFADRPALGTELKRLAKSAKGTLGLGRFPAAEAARAALDAYFAGESAGFDLKTAQPGTAFQHAVWDALRTIHPGETVSYSDLATRLGRPDATRAVARANGANQLALIVPCHRVIGSDGSLTGYGGGLWRKERLIALERHYAAKEKTNAH